MKVPSSTRPELGLEMLRHIRHMALIVVREVEGEREGGQVRADEKAGSNMA